MIVFFLIAFGIPLACATGAFVVMRGITWKEFGVILLAELAVTGTAAGIVSCDSTHDVEVWNGIVAYKRQDTVSCSHSYSCNCRQSCSTDSKGNQSCTTTCDTCYEHFHDYDWNVYTSNGEVITIDRVDRQGVNEPGRFTVVKVGDPTSQTHSYVNYVKASPDSLFRHQGLTEKYAGSIPVYPGEIYDYYRLDRLVAPGIALPEGQRVWNTKLADLNAVLGKSKQVNIIVVIVREMPADWYYALEEAWIGGKKNDVVLVISVDDGLKPQWATVMAWTTNEMFKVRLRDDITSMDRISLTGVISRLDENVRTNYVRKPMQDFEYLSSQITPTSFQWGLTLGLGMLVAVVLIFYFEHADPFGDSDYRWRRQSNDPWDVPFQSRRRVVPWYRQIFNTRPWEDV